MATTPATTMTIEELAALAALPDDGYQYELMRGELMRMPPSGFDHSSTGARLISRIGHYVYQHHLGEVTGADGGYVINRDERTVLAPDVAFVRADRLPPIEERLSFPDLIPDLVVEVVSPSDSAAYVTDKVLTYLEAGVREVWVVHPRRRVVQVHTPDRHMVTLAESDTLDGGDILPGFSIRVGDIFPG